MVSDVFAGLTRGVPDVSPREMAPPASHFEDQRNIGTSQSLRYTQDKLFLGAIGADITRDENTGERYAIGGVPIGVADDRHVITIAGSRAGKGRSAIVPNMLVYKGSILATDPKGELALLTARRRATFQRVFVVDPFNTTRGELPAELYKSFNPMAAMTDQTAVEDAALITDAIVMPSGNDPHWDESARTLIEGVILDVYSSPLWEGRRNLVTVRNLIAQGLITEEDSSGMDDVHPMDMLEQQMAESELPAVRRAGADFFEKAEKERGSVLSTARRHLRSFSFPEIERSLQGESFDLADLKRAEATVYLCLPARHIGTCGRWLRLFVNLALQAMERTEGKPAAGCPVLFCLDEFAALGHMREIEDAAGQIAGFGVKLWPVLQDLGQLKALYKERWETFMGNAGILQFFGNNDLTTLEWVSKRLGTTTIEQVSMSDTTPSGARSGATGVSYAPHTVPILEPDEVSLVFSRADPHLRQLVIRAGYAPMILQRVFYDRHEAFRELIE
jgi:type IV secretion system protein VirD4